MLAVESFEVKTCCRIRKFIHLQCVFIVLDLRLMKIGCRETTFPFLNPFVFLYSFVDI